MRLPIKQQAIIDLLVKRQRKIEKKQYQYERLLVEAENKRQEQKKLMELLKNEILNYEKIGIYSIISFYHQRRKKAIVLSSLNLCQTQLKEIIIQQEKLKEEKKELEKEYIITIKKQKKMQRYFDRKHKKLQVYLERLEQYDIQEIALYDNDII
ncbi:type III secretion protein [Proteus sp. NMG38-2]|uniref:type III secretion protein n=1 Tax=Proteus sp. NMG38-2 TaxID=2883107 RepID=UPI001D09C03A|nr:type III secretion protein [Proteus sp. NMG38-2]UDN35678.1 type III secretion protein [Proteus sp. NMG38-2]